MKQCTSPIGSGCQSSPKVIRLRPDWGLNSGREYEMIKGLLRYEESTILTHFMKIAEFQNSIGTEDVIKVLLRVNCPESLKVDMWNI